MYISCDISCPHTSVKRIEDPIVESFGKFLTLKLAQNMYSGFFLFTFGDIIKTINNFLPCVVLGVVSNLHSKQGIEIGHNIILTQHFSCKCRGKKKSSKCSQLFITRLSRNEAQGDSGISYC